MVQEIYTRARAHAHTHSYAASVLVNEIDGKEAIVNISQV